MREFIPPLLWAWALLSPLLFRLLPGRDAAIACLLAGWAFLPNEPYPPGAFFEPIGIGGTAQAVAVPTPTLANKATAIGLGCLLGLVLFDRRAFDRLRLDRVDLPIVAYCLVPLASAPANGLPFSEGLAQARYLLLAWGSPYLMGRAYLADEGSRLRFAFGMVAAGLAYLPLCLFEVAAGPMLYVLAYGPHPYQFDGAARLVGNRPMGFLEHGNQLGMWMASSAVAATWLSATGAARRPLGLPGGPLAAALVAAVLLCQSHASIVLLVVALLPLLASRAGLGPRAWRAVALAVAAAVLLAAALLAARRGFDLGSIRLEARDFFRLIRKSSFTWRLARSEEFLPIALERPVLGWARADWASGGRNYLNPVALGTWFLAFGMYGAVGLAASVAAWVLPVARAIGARRAGDRSGPPGGATGALIALVIINGLDGLSNSVAILPILAAAGGLNRPAGDRPGPA